LKKMRAFLPAGGLHRIPCLFHVWTLPVCVRQATDNESLMAPLHRQYKTARTETRWHLLLKTWQMPIQTSASRGYVLLSGGTRGTHKSPKIVCWLADTVRGVFQTWKDTDHRRCKSRLVRNAAFFEQNVSYAFQLKSTDKLSIILLITSKRNSLFGIVCLNEKRV